MTALGSIDKKHLSRLANFGCSGGEGGQGEGWDFSEFIKKGKFVTKIFFFK